MDGDTDAAGIDAMGRWKGFAALGFLGLFAWPVAVQAAEAVPTQVQASPADLDRWIAELGDEDYSTREQATQALGSAGKSAVRPLAAAAVSPNAEIAWRACAALEQIGERGDEQTLHAVLDSLGTLDTQNKPRLTTIVAEIKQRHAQFRRGRAIAQIRALGGEVSQQANWAGYGAAVAPPLPEAAVIELPTVEAAVDEPAPPPESPVTQPTAEQAEGEGGVAASEPAPPPDVLPVTPPGEVPPIEGEIADAFVSEDLITVELGGFAAPPAPVAPVAVAPVESAVTSLTLASVWHGGDSGVALLKDIPELQHLELIGAKVTDASVDHLAEMPNLSFLRVQETSITADGLRRLQAKNPSLNITAVGPAMLGVMAAQVEGGCQVTTVVNASAAAKAGIRQGDRIVEFDGQKVTGFTDLAFSVYGHKPGDKVSVTIERDGKSETLEIALQAR